MGWEIYPEGLLDLLLSLREDYGPRAIAITENGAAFDDMWDGSDRVHDTRRVAYLRAHVQALAVARMLGAPITSYFAWSLMYSRRFGIVYVDYASQRRIVKDSGRWYAELRAAHHACTRRVDGVADVRRG
jgi:beta-glucosidase